MPTDYVIVGAGSAGCAIAYRLTEAGHTVTLIEHGGTDAGPLIQMPGALSYPLNMPLYDWGYVSEPEPHMNNRRMACPRGKVIGGSSSINGMIYVRGHACDFDHWEEQGAKGWAFADVLPYYQRLENWHGAGRSDSEGADPAWRGTSGPLHISRGKRDNPLTQAWVKAGAEAGYPVTPDYNGQQQEGVGAFEATIFEGQRWSAAKAYLRPAQKSGKLRLVRALAQRVAFDGQRAVGVDVIQAGQPHTYRAHAEVILSASAINSPALLMQSGIGPGADLQALGIIVRADRPGVGGNLQDHLEVYMQTAATQPVSLFKYWSLFGKARVGLEWLLRKTGPGASNQFESTGFIRSAAGVPYPDIQFHFLPLAVRYDGSVAAEGHGYQAHVGPMRSVSRGRVSLKSADPSEAPRIQFNYMSDPQDWQEFRTAIRLTREILGQPAFAPYRGAEIHPGAHVQSDEEIDSFIREHAESAYHPCGTCKMGAADDIHAVVDPETRVIGVDGLRVADSSIFPRITNGNLNAPSIMTGEKAADHILGRKLPRAENMKMWMHPDWENQQR